MPAIAVCQPEHGALTHRYRWQASSYSAVGYCAAGSSLADTPRIAGGRQVVKLHLLSPARRSVQVTQDLKGRYPKHYWSDDPLVAEATARIKPRK